VEEEQNCCLMKRIASIIPYAYLPGQSGGQKSFAGFYEYLGKQTELYAIGVPENDGALATTYSLKPLLKSSIFRYADLFSIFRIKNYLLKNKIEFLIIEHPYLGWLGWMLKKTCGVKLIVHTHNIEYLRFRSIGKWWWRILKWYEGWTLRNADYVFCITEEDRQGMIKQLRINPATSINIPFGIHQSTIPSDKEITKAFICKQQGIDEDCTLLFFNGKLDYYPNTEAVDLIINKINPLLLQSNLKYEILIAGKDLPVQYDGLKQWNKQHIRYLGFVDDIDMYTKAADILLNPVMSGGGVKTKMIEALGLNTTVVSTVTGAAGVTKEACGEKLIITEDHNWQQFADTVIKTATTPEADIPEAFYREFSWKGIIEKALKFIS
jgi:polysaccharide biosynthesis protein PslH